MFFETQLQNLFPDHADNLCTDLVEIDAQCWKIVSVTHWRKNIGELDFQNFVMNVVKDQLKPVKVYKTGKQRTVSLIQQGQLQGVLKSYRPSKNFWQLTKQLMRGSLAAVEFKQSLQVKLLGISTPAPYCYLEPLDAFGSHAGFMLMQEIPRSKDLSTFDTRESKFTTKLIAQELGKLIALLQEKGIHHRDLHAENFLWQEETKALFLIDLQGISQGFQLTAAQINQQLGQLYYSLGREVSPNLRWEFWRTYQKSRSSLTIKNKSDLKQSFQDSLKLVSIHAQQCLERGDRKWERGNRRLRIINSRHKHSRALSSILPAVQREIHQQPDIIFTEGEKITPIKMSAPRQIAIVTTKLFAEPVFVKREELLSIKAHFPGWGKYAPARHAWEIGHALKRRKIPTPLPLLMTESWQSGKYSGMIITDALPQAIALSAYLETYLPKMKTARGHTWLKKYLSQLGTGIARMHLGRFEHRDLKSNNILVEHDAGLTGYWIIDLAAVRKWPLMLPYQRRTQNLARLAADLVKCPTMSSTLLLRGLKAYLDEYQPDVSSQNWKQLWHDITKQLSFIQQRKSIQQPKIERETTSSNKREAA
jgi:tRNA A-37 threonylcarbamoyl transferase component Bud32